MVDTSLSIASDNINDTLIYVSTGNLTISNIRLVFTVPNIGNEYYQTTFITIGDVGLFYCIFVKTFYIFKGSVILRNCNVSRDKDLSADIVFELPFLLTDWFVSGISISNSIFENFTNTQRLSSIIIFIIIIP
jgi:hypothetical protein